MQRKSEQEVFLKRERLIEGTIYFCFIILIGRLFFLQIIMHEKYSKLAGKIQFIENQIPAQRGAIYDRNGNILAMDVPAKTLYVYTKIVEDKDKMAKILASILNMPASEIRKKLDERYPRIKRKLTVEEYTAIEKEKLKGIVFEDDYKRTYPKGKLACHVLGFTNVDGVGIEGVELQYNDVLSGQAGLIVIPRDGRGNFLSSLSRVVCAPVRGKDIYLTIDEKIQQIVEEEIARCWEASNPKKISVIVMDPETGEILAMANKPDFDPNDPARFPAEFRKNYAVTDLFEPGSIFKIVTAAAVLEERKVGRNEVFNCEGGKWFIRGHFLHDAHPYGLLDFQQIIIKSSNIGTVKLAMRIGDQALYRYIKKFHFGELTGIDLPGEIRGILRPVEKWSAYSITAIPIGQEVGVTCLQAIRAICVFANGGYLVRPHILKKIEPPVSSESNLSVSNELVLSSEVVATLNEILAKVVSEEGTALRAKIHGYTICGKTGTGQKVENGVYSHSKFTASFIGFIPLEDPKVAILVNVDEPKGAYYGGIVAAPVFREIAWRIMQYMQVPPQNASIAMTGLDPYEDKRTD
ncbi:MAG: penicillin-binding protein 2 [Candidatus Omnitrophica bacterium]|nr:penicillin-binding protein 2 [Candidatus Omnitrophota bacterium]MCM8824693.1 penicillin-binding protein 2 [Candidatus Omnitrophota bacterium]